VGAEFLPSPPGLKAGVAIPSIGSFPINGLRHPPASDTTGWFIWGGEQLSGESEFFQPLHVGHLLELLPGVSAYLGLAPGWRFLLADDHEDVWFDSALLGIS
jgi:hypothetical protein